MAGNDDPLAGLLGGATVPSLGDDPAANTPADPAGQKNPLDVLEELLKESQAKAAGGAGGPGGAAAGAPASAEPAGPTPEQLQQQAELAEKIKQQAILDQQGIAEQQAKLADVKNSPQYQARVQQEQEKIESADSAKTAGQGFQIQQLEHKKI